MNYESEAQFQKSINKWTLSFNNEEIEERYRERKWNNLLLFIKVFVIISLVLHLYIRVKNLVTKAISYSENRGNLIREIIYLSVSVFALGSEVIVHLIEKLKYFKGIIYLITILCICKDSYYMQFYKILPTEPLYGITLVHTIIFSLVVCIYFCYSWITASIALSMVAVFYTIYDWCLFDLGIYDKIYYPLIHFSSFIMISVFVYNFEKNQRYLEFIFSKAEKESIQLKNMLGRIPLGILMVKKSILKFMNSTSCRILKYCENIKNTLLKLKIKNTKEINQNDLLKKLNDLKCEDDESFSLKNLIEEDTLIREGPFNLIRHCKNSEEIFECQIFDLILDNKKIKVYTIKDLTDQFSLNKEKSQKEYKQKMVASFTHDMRNPITGIIGCLEMMRPFSHDPLFIDYIDSAMCSSQLLLCLVNDILDMSRLEMNQLELNFEEVNIRNIINECIKIYLPNFKKKGLKLFSLIEEDVPEMIVSDGKRIMQILLNLVSNAFKFTQKGYVKIKCILERKSGKVMISVRDTGVGIASDDLNKLFKLFGKLERTSNINSGGIGIGLNFAKLLSNLLGGDIHVVSELASGSKFIVFLSPNSKESKEKNLEEERFSELIDSKAILLSEMEDHSEQKEEIIKNTENDINLGNIQDKEDNENQDNLNTDKPCILTVQQIKKSGRENDDTSDSRNIKSILYVDNESSNH